LVVLSALIILGGIALLLPSSALYSLITSGSSTSATVRFGSSASTSTDTTTIESLIGFGLLGVGLVLEVLSLFTDVGGAVPDVGGAVPDAGGSPVEKAGVKQA